MAIMPKTLRISPLILDFSTSTAERLAFQDQWPSSFDGERARDDYESEDQI